MIDSDVVFRERLVNYLNTIDAYRDGEMYSKLWGNFIREFSLGQDGMQGLPQLNQTQCRGYVPRERRVGRVDRQEWIEDAVGWSVNMVYVLAEAIAKRLKSKKVRHKYDWRTYRIKRFLRMQGIDYRAELSKGYPANSISSSFFALRAVYYQRLLLQYSRSVVANPQRILEVGAGVGTLAIMLARMLKPREYVVVDLPEMLPVLAIEVRRHYPEARVVFPNEEVPERSLGNSVTFVLRTPTQHTSIQDESVDIALNIDSFAEMPIQAARSYVEMFNRTLAKGGVMFLANRESRVHDGQAEINSMWTLPYDPNHEVMLFEHCPMRHYVMSGKTPNINRISRK
ncbi:putative sugar O-methyltransferase [Desulfovibrio ferrophilus]|uniref:Uncharacterized protein n=1 Tax=Desulfovibrio ferrophilus TaxID=241368 RepID=A0A2Z6B275_9BACT|nr:putative sugar O-methyltransferase [Desulfovibrio ferrophilus]BBD09585.1 uncharacterized protein DFE_2859 [Desulfovibrio ferrophilus]